MFKSTKWMRRWTIIAVAIGLFCSSPSPAKKPVKPPPDDDGVAIVWVSHDREQVERLADHVMVLRHGTVEAP